MEFDADTIAHLAGLARIEIDDAEARELSPQLDRILAYMRQLQKVDLGPGPPELPESTDSDGCRDDEPAPSLSHERVMDMAPEHDGEYFVVPRVVPE